jgi:hypothetical protein
MTRPDPPFPRHWLYNIVLKYGGTIAVILPTLNTAYLAM